MSNIIAMAMQKQTHFRKVDLEELVDIFLDDNLIDEPAKSRSTNIPDLGRTEADSDEVPAQDVTFESSHSQKELDVSLKSFGRELAKTGDEIWSHSTHRDSQDSVQAQIRDIVNQLAGRELSANEEQQHWQVFKEMMERALEDTGANTPIRMGAAVLVSIKGLSTLGKAARSLARRFSLRFLEEHKLRNDLERLGEIKNISHEDLD